MSSPSSSSKKVIAVLGATGAQGGGLVRAILADGTFAARAVTRDVTSAKARELAALGAEVVAADLYEPAELEKAFEGAHGVFAVTFFWAHMSADKETTESINVATAAANAKVEHVVFSSLEDTRQFYKGANAHKAPPKIDKHYFVPHFDAKGRLDAVYKALVNTTVLHTAFYWENFIAFGAGPSRGADGNLTYVLPMGDAPLPGIASADIGKVALGIFKKGKATHGQTVAISGEILTGRQIAEAFSKAFGEPVNHYSPSFEQYRNFGFPGAHEMANMYQYKFDDPNFAASRDPKIAREFNPELQNFEAWLKDNAALIPNVAKK